MEIYNALPCPTCMDPVAYEPPLSQPQKDLPSSNDNPDTQSDEEGTR